MPDIETLEKKRRKALEEAYHLQKQIDEKLDGQKSVLGSLLMAIAGHEPDRIPQILVDIENYVTNESDIKHIQEFKNSLESKVLKDTVVTPDKHMDNFKKLVASTSRKAVFLDGSPDDDIPF